MHFCSKLWYTVVMLHMLFSLQFLPYNFWMHWSLPVTLHKMWEISKIWHPYKVVKIRTWLEVRDASYCPEWGKDCIARPVTICPVWWASWPSRRHLPQSRSVPHGPKWTMAHIAFDSPAVPKLSEKREGSEAFQATWELPGYSLNQWVSTSWEDVTNPRSSGACNALE